MASDLGLFAVTGKGPRAVACHAERPDAAVCGPAVDRRFMIHLAQESGRSACTRPDRGREMHLAQMVRSTSTLCPAHSATWVGGTPVLRRSETPPWRRVIRTLCQWRGDLRGGQARQASLLPHG